MNEVAKDPFSRAEMEAMRRAADREENLFFEFRELFRRLFRRVPFAVDLATAYYCAIDPATSPRVKMILAGALAYFVMPLDGMADMLPFIGFTDDAAVLAAAIAAVRSAIEPRHRKRAEDALADLGRL